MELERGRNVEISGLGFVLLRCGLTPIFKIKISKAGLVNIDPLAYFRSLSTFKSTNGSILRL
jgi:hypothetical protein